MTTTFSVLAPAPNTQYTARGTGAVAPQNFTSDGFGLITGVPQALVGDLVGVGCIVLGAGTLNDGAAWNANANAPQLLAAAGASQGNAAKITQNRVTITATASTEGVILEAVATGAITEGYINGAHGAKIYPPVNGKFDQVTTTNEAKVVAGNKSFRVVQRSATAYQLELSA